MKFPKSKKPTVKESSIQESIIVYCRARNILVVAPVLENTWGGIVRMVLIQALGKPKGLSVAQRLIVSIVNRNKRMGSLTGTSDLIVILEGKVVFVELKSATGKATKEQLKFGSEVIKRGHAAYLCRSLNEFIEIINKETNNS